MISSLEDWRHYFRGTKGVMKLTRAGTVGLIASSASTAAPEISAWTAPGDRDEEL